MKKETLGGRLQRLRSEAGLTQMQVSERAGVPLTTLRNWEQDRREPLASALFKLARALGVSCEAFTDSSLQPPAAEPTKPRGRPKKGTSTEPMKKDADVIKPAPKKGRGKKSS
ncbi:MAG TPA: helix-turn-helix transcriptional regulator [Gemmataceae bacterium]|nr:helix-turn-helix transcriptional regulator [Gemmataceae bacterium]